MEDYRKIKPFYGQLFKKMLNLIGKEYDDNKEYPDESWWADNEWAPFEQITFHKWLVFFLQKELKINKNSATEMADLFIMEHGWKFGFRPEVKHGLISLGVTPKNKYQILKSRL